MAATAALTGVGAAGAGKAPAGPELGQVTWRSIGPAHFGAMYAPTFSPHDSKVIVSGVDMGNAALYLCSDEASMVTGVAMAVYQTDLKRLLAYSSVEHMGILAVGVGLGAGWGVLFHALNHSLVKGCLFLAAGIAADPDGLERAVVLPHLQPIIGEDPEEHVVVDVAVGWPEVHGHVEPFLLVLRPASRLDDVRVAVSDLTGPQGAVLPSSSASLKLVE